jgi:hypothetical protein
MRRYFLALRLQGRHTFLLGYELLVEVAADDATTANRSSEIRGQPVARKSQRTQNSPQTEEMV